MELCHVLFFVSLDMVTHVGKVPSGHDPHFGPGLFLGVEFIKFILGHFVPIIMQHFEVPKMAILRIDIRLIVEKISHQGYTILEIWGENHGLSKFRIFRDPFDDSPRFFEHFSAFLDLVIFLEPSFESLFLIFLIVKIIRISIIDRPLLLDQLPPLFFQLLLNFSPFNMPLIQFLVYLRLVLTKFFEKSQSRFSFWPPFLDRNVLEVSFEQKFIWIFSRPFLPIFSPDPIFESWWCLHIDTIF